MRRLRGWCVSVDAVVSLCRGGAHVIQAGMGVPESARFVGAYFDYPRCVFIVHFEDASFDEVAEGSLIPLSDGPEVVGDWPEDAPELPPLSALDGLYSDDPIDLNAGWKGGSE